MKNRSINKSFCYPMDDVSDIEKAERLAAEDNVSFSEWILALIKAKVKEEYRDLPIDNSAVRLIEYQNPINEVGVNEDLRKYIPNIIEINNLEELRQINLTARDLLNVTGKKISQILTVKQDDAQRGNRYLRFTYDRSRFNLQEK